MCAVIRDTLNTTPGTHGQRVCPDPECSDPDCGGECLLAEPTYDCASCGAPDPFHSEPDCQACREVRNEIAHSAESAAGWDATP
jgi:hypothetical protein